jgi:hypothetical protein
MNYKHFSYPLLMTQLSLNYFVYLQTQQGPFFFGTGISTGFY